MEKAFLNLVIQNIKYNVKGTITARFEGDTIIITITTDKIYRWTKEHVRENMNTLLPSDIARWLAKDYEKFILRQYFIPIRNLRKMIKGGQKWKVLLRVLKENIER